MIIADRPFLPLQSVEKGQPHTEVINLTNTSDKEITIKPWSSCTCTVASTECKSIKPGETIPLTMVYTPPSGGMDEKELGVIFAMGQQLYKLIIRVVAKVK